MASTYTTNQGIEKPGTGEQSGTWGATTNTNFDIIDRALSGVGALSLTGTSTTLTTTDGSLTDGMYKVLVLGGSPSGTNTITLSDNTQDKFYFVVNASGEEVQFSQGTGANATIANGYADIIYADGAGSGAAVASLFATGLKIGTDLKVGDDLSLVSDSAVLGFGADNDTTLTHTDGTGLTLNSTNKLTFGDAASFIQQSGDGILQIDGEATINMNASTALTVTTDTATFTSANSTDPVVIIKNTTNDTSAARLHFVKDKGAAGADGDDIGTIEFISDDSGQAQTSFAKIVAEVSESANTDEAGKLSLFVAESDGTTTALTAGLVLEGEHATDGEVDVTIGAATTSTTTVAGNLVVTTSVEGGVVFNESSADVDFRVESNGQTHKLFVDGGNDVVCLGLATPETIGGQMPGLQIEGTDYKGGQVSIWRNANDDAGAYLILGKSRGTALNSDTIVQADDDVGIINFIGADGGDRAHPVASIRAAVDGTPGSNDMPGRIEFMTTGDGGTTLSEKMRITHGGSVGVNIQADADMHNLQVLGASNDEGIVVRGSNGGIIQIVNSTNSNDDFLGQLGFANLANADVDATDADGQTVAWIRARTITSDSNAGDDSGAYLQFVTSNEASSVAEVGRVYNGLWKFYDTSTSAISTTAGYHHFAHANNDTQVLLAYGKHSSYAAVIVQSTSLRTASSSHYFFGANSDDGADAEFYVRGDGVVASDGANNLGSGADYAEFFETTDGKAIAVGTTVVLENNKVRASKSSDSQSSVIGVVRPKSTGGNQVAKVGVVGNTACMRWMNKYLIDDYGAYIMEETTMTKWTSTVENSVGGNEEREFIYETDKIPADGTDIWGTKNPPSDAVVYDTEPSGELKGKKILRRKLNSDFDDSKEYVKREDRDEWVIVGLMGQVAITKGQKMGDRWIKMRDISDTVEEYMIR
jgi:hypothetical protein